MAEILLTCNVGYFDQGTLSKSMVIYKSKGSNLKLINDFLMT